MEQLFSDYLSHLTSPTTPYPPAIFDLLSQGKVYPSTHSFFKTQKIIYSKLTGKDEEFAGEILFKVDPYQLNVILEASILNNDNPKISISDMLVCDRDLMIYNHRISIFKLKFAGVEMFCRNCQKSLNTQDLRIEKANDRLLEIDPCIPNTNTFEWEDVKKRFKILFRFPTVQIQEYFDSVQNTLGKVSTKEWISQLVIKINDLSSISEILETLKYETAVYKQFRKYVFTNMPQKFFVTNKLVCAFCQTDNTIRSKIDMDLLPFRVENFREVCTDEYVFMMKELHLPMSEILEMPIERRKHIIERYQKLSKPADPNDVIPQKGQRVEDKK